MTENEKKQLISKLFSKINTFKVEFNNSEPQYGMIFKKYEMPKQYVDGIKDAIIEIESMPITEGKETNLEHYKEQLKQIFREDYCDIATILYRIKKEIDSNVSEDGYKYLTNAVLDWMAKPYKQPILDAVEKKYLSAALKPFKGGINFIQKREGNFNHEYISVNFVGDMMRFPPFEKGTMYKGMEINKKYKLEELGL